uniref:LOX10 n=1 Tax=Arundo donax TaxID=35708 RepID=A0A0A9FHG9_ARUDO
MASGISVPRSVRKKMVREP